MKRFLAIVFFAMLMSLIRCSSYNPISELDAFASELENNSSSYTVDDWENAFQTYEGIIASMEGIDLTDEEIRKLGRINGVCTAHLAKGALVLAKDASSTGLTFLEGLVDGFKSTFGEQYIENAADSFEEKLESLIDKYE